MTDSELKLLSQHCALNYGKKVNKTQLAHVSSPLNYDYDRKIRYQFGPYGATQRIFPRAELDNN